MGKFIHGQRRTRLYSIWTDMKTRCYNTKRAKYARYGGRGIKVCAEWLNNFQVFHDWAMANGYSDNLTIDRINNDGDYSPENCRWTDTVTQSNNRRCNIMVTRNGETHTLAEWARIKELPYKTLLMRYRRHGDTENLFMELKK